MRCIFSVRCNLLLDTYGASIYVQRSDDLKTKQFYESDCITGIFVNKSFRQSAYDERECFQAAEDTEELVRSPLEPKSWRLSEIIAIRESAAQAECCKLS